MDDRVLGVFVQSILLSECAAVHDETVGVIPEEFESTPEDLENTPEDIENSPWNSMLRAAEGGAR